MEIHFAPIQGHTDRIYREAFRKIFGGLDSFYTPFVRVERGVIRNKDLRELAGGMSEVNLVPQIMAGSAEEFRILIGKVSEYGYRRIDINMGCPFPLITGSGRGAAMVANPEKMRQVLDCIYEYPDIKFSLKVRIGFDSFGQLAELMPYLNTLPLVHLTVHPRTSKQQYKGQVDIQEFAKIYDLCKLPLIYNGDLKSVTDIERIIGMFPNLKGVMIGRGLLENPMLAEWYLSGTDIDNRALRTKIQKFHGLLLDEYGAVLQGERQLLTKMQSIWEYLRITVADERCLKKMRKCTSLAKYLGLVGEYLK